MKRKLSPIDDPTSLGNVLLKQNLVTPADLEAAIKFQQTNPDVMLGEALIKMGRLDRSAVEALLFQQQALRGKDAKHAATKVMELAVQGTRETSVESRGLRYALTRLLEAENENA